MLPKENYKDDLEYLAQLGYETVSVTDSDISDLKKRVKKRVGASSRFYFGVGSLLVGMVIGGVLFYVFNKNPEKQQIATKDEKGIETLSEDKVTNPELIFLDTIIVAKENFIYPKTLAEKQSTPKKSAQTSTITSPEVMHSKPLDASILLADPIKETQLKYISNSPIFYLHDMKITNYTTLYFKKERFVKFTGVSAVYSNTNEISAAGSSLKQTPEYYLHEEIAQAMLLFKNEKYDETIQALKKVAKYNKVDLNCDFYLGMSYYHKKNFDLAIDYFNKCLLSLNNTFLQEATYYKAVSFFERGNKEDAKALFQEIAAANEFYAEKASEYLKN